jgi:N-acyl-D-amino-acid deacylase
LLRPAMGADVVAFNSKIVQDRATFQQPKQHATGFDYAIVNGQMAIEKTQHLGAKREAG